jgi:acyl-CoA thioesterase-2
VPDTFADLIDLEEVDRDIYRALFRREGRSHLYGGQVAAQALKAAGLTVAPDRRPHSLHGYFLRVGDAARPTVFRVERDRDGRSFSARRVIALQGGEVIFNMSCSFHVHEDGYSAQELGALELAPPEELPPYAHGLVSVDMRAPETRPNGWAWATRFWVRLTDPLPDDELTHACALTYVSDISTGLVAYADATQGPGSSIDHTVYFHRPLRADSWVLMDVAPHVVAHGRGVYTGAITGADGAHAVTIVQEGLFRPIDFAVPAGRNAGGG